MANILWPICIFFIFLNTSNVEAKTVSHTFEVKYFSGSQDGVYKEKIIGINGQFPGPTIEAEVGDILQIDLVNNLQDGQNATIHWHGIHQKHSHCEDGTSQISQCPLRNGHTQRYWFPVNQTGTYWYHSHVKSQYTEGLWGALIVHKKAEDEIYSYDGDILITLNDWYHRSAKENEEWHISPTSRGVPPYPESGLINGQGRFNCIYAGIQNRTCNPADQKRKVFRVQRDKTYRIRVINTSAISAFNFSIDGHKLKVIEVDGTDVTPNTQAVDIVPIAAAQRYSFLVYANKPTDRYLIRAHMRTDSMVIIAGANINQYPESLMPNITAVLQYIDNPNFEPIISELTEFHSYLDSDPPRMIENPVVLNQDVLSPYDGNYAPDYVDQEFILIVDFFEDFENIRRGSFNRTPFVLPEDKPLLMTLLDGQPIPERAFPLTIGYMNVIQLVINNDFLGPHPLHLHGHSFWVLGSGEKNHGPYDPTKHNLTLNGVKRDTFLVEEYSWAVIRFVADNPGIWTFHCHIDYHNLSGMALTFVEAPEKARAEIKMTEEANRVCGLWKD